MIIISDTDLSGGAYFRSRKRVEPW